MRLPARTRGILFALALLPCVLAVLQLGRLHPDEVYQFLEPAFFRARGYGVLAWEWQAGLRNWAVPLLLSVLLRASDALGVESPRVYRAVLALPQLALHTASLFAIYSYAERRAGERALTVTLLVGLYGPLLAFAGRTLGESISASFLLLALEALDRQERPTRAGAVGGLWLGLSVVARYGSAVMVLAALLWLVMQKRWRVLGAACATGAGVALGLGLLDQVTWHAPFHSLLEYARFNVLTPGAANRFGTEGHFFFVPFVAGLTPLWAWWGLAQLARRDEARPLPSPRPFPRFPPLGLFLAAVYLIAISFTPHKEQRFLYPAMVLGVVDAAVGFVGALELFGPGTRRAGLFVAVLLTLLPYLILVPQRGDQFRAEAAASRGSDVTGLLMVNEGLWGSGGYFYLGKRIPWDVCDWPQDVAFQRAMAAPVINRAVTYEGRALPELEAAGFRVRERVGNAQWLSRGQGP